MSVVLHVKSYTLTDAKLDTTLEQLGKSAVEAMADEWETTLKSARTAILNALKTVIPNADTYRSIMLNRALPKLQSVFNPDYPKYKKIIARFKAKQMGAYGKWSSGIDSAFAEGGAFDTGITHAKDSFKTNVRAVLKVVGVRPLALGPAPKIMMWLSGDTKVHGYRDAELDTVWDGTPTNVFDPALPFLVRQTVIPIIVEGIYIAEMYNIAGATSDRDTWLGDYSAKFKALLDKLVDSSKYVVDIAEIKYDTGVSNYYVEVQISTTT